MKVRDIVCQNIQWCRQLLRLNNQLGNHQQSKKKTTKRPSNQAIFAFPIHPWTCRCAIAPIQEHQESVNIQTIDMAEINGGSKIDDHAYHFQDIYRNVLSSSEVVLVAILQLGNPNVTKRLDRWTIPRLHACKNWRLPLNRDCNQRCEQKVFQELSSHCAVQLRYRKCFF